MRALALALALCLLLPMSDGKASKRTQSGVARLRAQANKAAQGGDCESASEAYRQLIELDDGQTQDDYNNLGVCLQMFGDLDAAKEAFAAGIERFYHSEKLHGNMGSLLEEWANREWMQGRGGDNRTQGMADKATKHLVFALRLNVAALWHKHAGKVPKLRRIEVGKKTVAIFYREKGMDQLSEGVWGPSVVDDESLPPHPEYESTAFVARHLVKMGFNVELYANIPERDFGLDKYGVNWRPFYAIHGMLPPVWNESHVLWPKLPTEKLPDVFVSVNDLEAAHLYNSSVHNAKNLTKPVSYLWLRTIPHSFALLTETYARPLHGIITLGAFHAATLPRGVGHCVRVSRDAVEQEAPHVIRQTTNANHRFVYAGFAGAGLELVLREWGEIRGTRS